MRARSAVWSGSENASLAYQMSGVSADADDGPAPHLFPVHCRRWFHQVRVRSGQRGGSGSYPCLRAERRPWLSPAAARSHLPEIQ